MRTDADLRRLPLHGHQICRPRLPFRLGASAYGASWPERRRSSGRSSAPVALLSQGDRNHQPHGRRSTRSSTPRSLRPTANTSTRCGNSRPSTCRIAAILPVSSRAWTSGRSRRRRLGAFTRERRRRKRFVSRSPQRAVAGSVSRLLLLGPAAALPGVRGSDCVPLAVVTIDIDNCRVIEICNWQAREFALTLPTLYYWTSFINWGAIKDVIAKLCCGPRPNGFGRPSSRCGRSRPRQCR